MDQTNTIQIQLLLAENKTAEALDLLLEQNNSSDWKETVLLLKANLLNVDKQLMDGVIDYAAAQLQFNRINSGALKVLTYLGTGTGDAEKILAEFKKEYSGKNIVENTTRISNSNIDIKNSDGVIIGSGNTVTQKIFKALGKKQFWTILVGVVLIGIIGIWGGQKLFSQQKGNYHSLNDIKKELTVLADLNNNVKAQLEKNGIDLNDWLAKGMQAMDDEDFVIAVQYLEKVAENVPLATVHQNLSVVYEKLENIQKSKDNLNEAAKINPNIKLPSAYANLKGQRINLLLENNGGEVLAASTEIMNRLTNGNDQEKHNYVYHGQEITYGFMDERKASFDMFTTLIKGDAGNTLKDFELSYSNDSFNGPFEIIDTFTALNKYLPRTPFQEFKFKKTTAKYFRFKALSCAGNNNHSEVPEIELWGELK